MSDPGTADASGRIPFVLRPRKNSPAVSRNRIGETTDSTDVADKCVNPVPSERSERSVVGSTILGGCHWPVRPNLSKGRLP